MGDDKASRWRWIRRIAPWLIGGAAITAILLKHPPAEIALEMQRGALLPTIPFAVALAAGAIFAVSGSDWVVVCGTLGDLGAHPGYLQMVRGRAGMALLGMLGYGAGVGGHGVWLARITGVGVGLTGGMVLYLMSTDLVAVSSLAALSIWIAGVTDAGALRYVAPAIAAILLLLKIGSPYGPLKEERLPAVFRPWKRMPVSSALGAVALRGANICFITLLTWGAAGAFGMPIPLGVWLAYFPVILVVGSMPVNVAGFGAVQGAWLLFEPWAVNGEQVLAFSVLWNLVIAVCIVARGLPFVRGIVAEIAQGTK